MSDLPADNLDLRAVLARIDRDLAESAKLRGETEKFVTEQRKVATEAREDEGLAPVLATAAVAGGLLGAATFIARLMNGGG